MNGLIGQRFTDKQIARLERKTRAIELFVEGWSAFEIADEIGCNLSIVYDYLQEVRAELIRSKSEHFAVRTAILVDNLFASVAVHVATLSDEKFLQTAAPERIEQVARSAGILTDKLFILATRSEEHTRTPVT